MPFSGMMLAMLPAFTSPPPPDLCWALDANAAAAAAAADPITE
jgi:hypothetical protein